MRIFVVEPTGKGGLIHYSYHMCRALHRAGADVTLITSTNYELEDLDHPFRLVKLLRLWDTRQAGGSAVIRKLRRGWRGVRYVVEWLRLILYLRRERPDVVLLGEVRFSFEFYFLRMLRASGLTLADVVHDVRSYDTRRGKDTILNESAEHLAKYDLIYHLFDALFVHDKINRDLFLELYSVPADRVHEIPHGANEIMLELDPTCTPDELRERLGIQPEERVALFFGTLTKYKGVEDLIRAFPDVRRAVNARLVIAGFPAKDIDPGALRDLAAKLGVADHIAWWLDYVPNGEITPLVGLSDVVVLPYRAITQSGIIQIAYACGKPVVATSLGGLVDVIEDGQSGRLVEPGNLAELSQAITEILQDPEQAAAMGDRARELAETRYSWRHVASLVLAALRGIKEPHA
jgi:glycosyltransferase involved in cell wall biosynthesis